MFKNHVRENRLALGLTITDVAVRAQLDRSAVGYVERGERWGRPATQRAIAAALGMKARDCFPL